MDIYKTSVVGFLNLKTDNCECKKYAERCPRFVANIHKYIMGGNSKCPKELGNRKLGNRKQPKDELVSRKIQKMLEH